MSLESEEKRNYTTDPWAGYQQADIEAVMFCLLGAEAAARQHASSVCHLGIAD